MPHNLELKARIVSPERAAEIAASAGARRGGILHQVDTYFRVRNGRMKLREFSTGEAELIVYERPEVTQERWSTYQKLPVSDPRGLRELLGGMLGTIAEVRKTRVLYLLGNVRIHIDAVEKLGAFVEFEIQDSGQEESGRTMAHLRSLFSISPGDIILGSYSEMILQGGAMAR